jgi:hypothetical protein
MVRATAVAGKLLVLCCNVEAVMLRRKGITPDV